MILAILWVALCFIIATVGSNKNIGYWGTFLISFFFSPLVGLIVGLVSAEKPAPAKEYQCRFCGFKSAMNSHFCPACEKDSQGKTKEDYKSAQKG